MDAALQDAQSFGTAEQVAACHEQVLAAQVSHAEAQAPINFHVNYCFSPNGTELTAMTVQSWIESRPDEEVLSNVWCNMYQEGDRCEMFRALRTRPEFQQDVPVYRTFYGLQSRIILVREAGELTIPIIERDATAADTEDIAAHHLHDDAENDIHNGDGPITVVQTVLRTIRSC